MKQPLPLALRTVMDGRLTMRQAHSLWAYAAYGVSPADDAESQARAMNYCRRDLSPWLFSGPLNDPDNAWIDFQAFVGLAAMHGVDIGSDLIHAASTDMEAKFRQAVVSSRPTSSDPPSHNNQQPPGNGRLDRRQALVRILDALKQCDPSLREDDMPGIKADFLDLCQDLNPHLFTVAQSSFNDAIKGWLGFRSGAKSTHYYRDRQDAIRAKLG